MVGTFSREAGLQTWLGLRGTSEDRGFSPRWGEERPVPGTPLLPAASSCTGQPAPHPTITLLLCWEPHLDTEPFVLMLLLGAQLSRDENQHS